MPKYDFQCRCGNEFESVVRVGKKTCKCKCGMDAVKVFTPPNFMFKGGGFYSDTYKEDRRKSIEKEIANIKV